MEATITLTIKVQVYLSPEDRERVVSTCRFYRRACNYVSEYVFENGFTSFEELHDKLYHTLREDYCLKSQMAQSCIRTVLAKYKSVESNGHERRLVRFKVEMCELVHGRDWSIRGGHLSLNTVVGRVKAKYEEKVMGNRLLNPGQKLGTCTVVLRKDGRVFLHIPATIAVETMESPSEVVGIDRGIRQIAVSYDGKRTQMFSGREIKKRRAHYSAVRKELQQRKTPSARRRLKAIGHRENGWMRDVNHCISKALVKTHASGTLFVLEDLTGIRKATERVRLRDRYVSVSWSYGDLEQKLDYKARLNGGRVITVNPRYTSQRCPVCGTVCKHSRNKSKHVYKCRHCGYTSNDDRVAAMNLYQLGLEYLTGNKHPSIQSPAGKPAGVGCSQSPRGAKQRLSRRKKTCNVTPRPSGRKKVGARKSGCTTGQSQAH